MRELTEGEEDKIGREMLQAALQALGELPGNVDEEDQSETARRVVRAIAAAEEVKKAELKRLADVIGEHVYTTTWSSEVVASAFYLWSECDGIGEIAPVSVIGSRYLGFAQGMAAARTISEALDLLHDGSIFAFDSSAAKHLTQLTDVENEDLAA